MKCCVRSPCPLPPLQPFLWALGLIMVIFKPPDQLAKWVSSFRPQFLSGDLKGGPLGIDPLCKQVQFIHAHSGQNTDTHSKISVQWIKLNNMHTSFIFWFFASSSNTLSTHSGCICTVGIMAIINKYRTWLIDTPRYFFRCVCKR